MKNIVPNQVDIQNRVDNFEAVIKSGDVRLIAQHDEVKLYRDSDNVEYIYDGGSAYSEFSEEFADLKARYFHEANS